MHYKKHIAATGLLAALFTFRSTAQKEAAPTAPTVRYQFDFGRGKTPPGYIQVLPGTRYTPEQGYGIDLGTTVTANSRPGGKNALQDGYLTAGQPFYFSVKLPEGNYRVKVTLGDAEAGSDAAIRAECRRMMVNRIQTGKGQHKTVSFTVHVRDSLIAGTNRKVKLKAREYSYLHWDDKLTLEFNGQQPKINAIEILPEQPEVVTVFLAGNSTVVDGANEPYAAWGQMFPEFFQPGKVAIANYAESGETLSSFIRARRFEKALSLMKPGDYAFVEFGHNDQKAKGPGVGAFTTYTKDLKFFIAEVKKKGATPVLVTSVQRRRFDSAGRLVETLGDYPEAVRRTAKAQNVPLIDLNALSKILFEAWGPAASIDAFAHFAANTYPGQTKPIADNTHFRPFGAYEIARLVLKGVRDGGIGLAGFIKPEVQFIDPTKPDSIASFYWPPSPLKELEKPDGN